MPHPIIGNRHGGDMGFGRIRVGAQRIGAIAVIGCTLGNDLGNAIGIRTRRSVRKYGERNAAIGGIRNGCRGASRIFRRSLQRELELARLKNRARELLFSRNLRIRVACAIRVRKRRCVSRLAIVRNGSAQMARPVIDERHGSGMDRRIVRNSIEHVDTANFLGAFGNNF